MAVLLVVVGHAFGVSAHGHRASALGVSLFFVLSGFLITALLLEEYSRHQTLSLRRFYARRGRRLLPAAVVVLVCVTTVEFATGNLGLWWGSVGATAFYVANFTKAAGIPFQPLGHAWSLSMEEQFYVIWPLVLFLWLRARRSTAWLLTGLVVSAVVIAAWRAYLWQTTGNELRTAWAPDTRADALLVGCALGVWFVSGHMALPRPAAVVAWFAVIALAVPEHGDWLWTWGLICMIAVSAVLTIGAITCPSRWLTLRPLVAIGRVSYGLYLWHYVLMTWFATGDGIDRVLMVTATIPVAALLSIASYRWIERPFMRGSNRRWRGGELQTSPPVSTDVSGPVLTSL